MSSVFLCFYILAIQSLLANRLLLSSDSDSDVSSGSVESGESDESGEALPFVITIRVEVDSTALTEAAEIVRASLQSEITQEATLQALHPDTVSVSVQNMDPTGDDASDESERTVNVEVNLVIASDTSALVNGQADDGTAGFNVVNSAAGIVDRTNVDISIQNANSAADANVDVQIESNPASAFNYFPGIYGDYYDFQGDFNGIAGGDVDVNVEIDGVSQPSSHQDTSQLVLDGNFNLQARPIRRRLALAPIDVRFDVLMNATAVVGITDADAGPGTATGGSVVDIEAMSNAITLGNFNVQFDQTSGGRTSQRRNEQQIDLDVFLDIRSEAKATANADAAIDPVIDPSAAPNSQSLAMAMARSISQIQLEFYVENVCNEDERNITITLADTFTDFTANASVSAGPLGDADAAARANGSAALNINIKDASGNNNAMAVERWHLGDSGEAHDVQASNLEVEEKTTIRLSKGTAVNLIAMAIVVFCSCTFCCVARSCIGKKSAVRVGDSDIV